MSVPGQLQNSSSTSNLRRTRSLLCFTSFPKGCHCLTGCLSARTCPHIHFECHVQAHASLRYSQRYNQLSLVCHSLQGSALTLLHPLWLVSALTCSSCPAFSCLVSAAPASTRRQLALRTRQIPADGGPRGRHAKYSKILQTSNRILMALTCKTI